MNHVLNRFKNKYNNESVVLFAPGPTLNEYDVNAIPLGFYKAGVNGVLFHQHIRELLNIYVWSGDIDTEEHPQPSAPKIYTHFCSLSGVYKFVCCYTNGGLHYPGFTEPTQIHPNDIPSDAFAFNQTAPKDWNPNLIDFGLDCNSVAFQALQLLLFMGFTEIHLVGFDCHGSHSYQNFVKGDICDWDTGGPNSLLIKLWTEFKQTYLKVYYPDVKICVVNPIGLKGLFAEV